MSIGKTSPNGPSAEPDLTPGAAYAAPELIKVDDATKLLRGNTYTQAYSDCPRRADRAQGTSSYNHGCGTY